MTSRWRLLAASVVAIGSACSGREAADIAPATSPTHSLVELSGEGYRLSYPARARVDTLASAEPGLLRTVRIIGPSIAVRPAAQNWEWVGPGYRLEIGEYDAPGDVALEAWVREQVRRAGGPPARLEDVTVAGLPARLAITFGGDSDIHTYYVRAGHRILGLRHEMIPQANSPTAAQQDALHALLLATLRVD